MQRTEFSRLLHSCLHVSYGNDRPIHLALEMCASNGIENS